MKFQSNSIFNGKITANSVADAGTNTDKFLVLSSNGDVSYRTAAELYIDLGIGSLPSGYTSTLKHQVKAGVALTKGQAVYVTSADGTNMIVGKASNASESTSSKTLGLIETSLSNNGIGNVITEGLLAGLDTTGANAAGDPVWLGTDGNLIYGLLNKPSAPAHLVFIGVVTRINANNGEIFVKVQNGFEMGELHNYAESGVANNDVIVWESSSSLYKPKSISTILGYTPANASTYVPYNGATTGLDLGIYSYNGNSVLINGNGTTQNGTLLFKQGGALAFNSTGYSGIGILGTTSMHFNFNQSSGVYKQFNFNVLGLTNNTLRTLNIPDATGTIALTSDLSSYVPTSRTLTINGTTYDLSANRSWTVSPNQNARTEYEFTTNGSTATYSATYSVGQVDVFYNGSKLASTEFTATTGTSVVLGFTPPAGQIVEVVAWETGGGVSNGRTLTINGVSYDLSADRSWTISTGVSGSGTTNYIPKWSSSTGLGNSTIYDNGSAIGINTTSPLANLHVYNGSAAASILLQTNSSTDYAEIAVRNAAAVATSYFRQYSASATGSDFGISRAGLALFFSNYATNFAIGTRNGGDLILGTADTERARLLASNGYLGIGTSSPSYLLDVNGTGRFTGALNGTSATFSGVVTLNAYGNQLKIGSNGATDSFIGQGSGQNNLFIGDYNTATKGLTINVSTGAATFSSSVTAGGELNIGSGALSSDRMMQISGTSFTSGTGQFGLVINPTFGNTITNVYGIYLANNIGTGVTNRYQLYIDAASGTPTNDYAIYSANSNKSYFAGNVGIGTSSPTWQFEVYNNTSNSGAGGYPAMVVKNPNVNGYTAFYHFVGSTNVGGLEYQAATDYLRLNSYGSLLFQTGSGQERMRITSGGLVAVNSSTVPNGQMYINGGSNSDVLSLQNTLSTGAYLVFADNVTPTWPNAPRLGAISNDMVFKTLATERMRITSGGNVGIGTSSINYKLEVVNSTNQYVFHSFNSRNTSGDANVLFQLGNNCNNTGSYFLVASMPLGDRMYIYGNGNIVNTNGSYGTLSDINLKENIVNATPKLADILQLKVRNFNLIGEETKQIGFIAQEFEEVFPSMIDIDGKTGMKTIKTSVLTPMHTKAIQELYFLIQEQQKQIEELKARLN